MSTKKKAPPKPPKRLTITLRGETYDALQGAAAEQDRSMSYLAEHVLAGALGLETEGEAAR